MYVCTMYVLAKMLGLYMISITVWPFWSGFLAILVYGRFGPTP